MSSILTNTSSMVALQTLKSINRGMAKVQDEISTGMKVATAKDNASTWAIAQTMRSDVGGFKQLSDALATGAAAVSTGRTAAETVSDLLSEMKEKIVLAQSPSADRAKIQNDVNELRNQIASVVSSAQFSGLNLVSGGLDAVRVLASLDRAADQSVSAGYINVERQDLRTVGLTADATSRVVLADSGTKMTATIGAVAVGDVFRLTVNGVTAQVTAATGDDDDAIAAKLGAALGFGTVATNKITFDPGSIASLEATSKSWVADTNAGAVGGLANLSILDVSDAEGAQAALADIESLIQVAVDASAALGSSQQRIEIQSDFVSELIDSMNAGIGAMVDADMEEASARLAALQTQQQLGIQALSIANQAPQNVLALFR